MSRAVETSHTAGGLEGLGLGAPIGGASSTTPVTGGYSSTTSTTTGTGSGLTGGLTGDHHHHHHNNTNTGSHLDRDGDAHRTSVGANASSALRYGAENSTSGDRGIGGGHGGPTAFESDPSAVGTDRSHDRPNSHSYGDGAFATPRSQGSHPDRDGDLHRTSAGAKAEDLKDAATGQRNTTHTSGHYGSGLAAGGLAAGGAAGVVSDLGARDHTSSYEGVVGDSITGQQHFAGGNNTGLTGQFTTTSTSRHTGAGAAGLTGGVLAGGAAATGVSPGTLSGHKSGHSRTGSKEGGMVSELKKELKDHQSSGGYSESSHHVESDGPHGLVWDSKSNKYVHRRELDNHGSTGVPLK